MTDEGRKSLREMAEKTQKLEAEAGIGLSCPRCGCRDTRVLKTWHNNDGTETTRRRVCRHCGHRLLTMEFIS